MRWALGSTAALAAAGGAMAAAAERPNTPSALQQSAPPTTSGATASAALWSFGVIADIQYCDCPEATNYHGTETRDYRGSLEQVRCAATYWSSLPSLQFIAQLGDLIDGQNAGTYGAGVANGVQSDVAFQRVADALSACAAPVYHAIGNHELYNYDWAGLRERLNVPSRGWRVSADDDDHCCFAARPVEGWTILTLNAYEVSILQERSLPGYRAAAALLREYNPNASGGEDTEPIPQGVDFFDNLVGVKRRYVPFNGGLGERQLRWLRAEVVAARTRGDRILVLSHLPLHVPAASKQTVAYDSDEAMKILHEDGCGRVVAVLAGHLHRGGYAVDGEGVHHVTLQSPLTHRDAYGHVDVYSDRLELVTGESSGIPRRSMPFPELHLVPSGAAAAAAAAAREGADS